MNKKIIKRFLIILVSLVGMVIIGFIGYVLVIAYAFGDFDKNYSVKELIENYNKKSKEIKDVKLYFNNITPKYKIVEIEFASDEKIERFSITPKDTGRGSDLTVEFLDWNLKTKSRKVDSLLKVLGWNDEVLTKLKKKLDDANCISIISGDPAKIGFKRSGMGMYFFNVFDNPIPDSLKRGYNDSCTYIYANKNLVLEYGGGAVGNQCFFNKRH